MWALIRIEVELFFGNLLPGIFDLPPFGLMEVFLCDIELRGLVFRGQKSVHNLKAGCDWKICEETQCLLKTPAFA